MALDLTPPPLAQLHCMDICSCRGVCLNNMFWAMHALAPIIHVTPTIETIATLHHLHPLAKVDLPPFVNNFHPYMDLVLDREAFISTLKCFPCLSFNDPSSMVYELLWNCFILDDSVSDFDIFLRYTSTSFMVIFLHQYHVCLLHCNFWFWKNKPEVLNPSRLERWFIG